MFQGLLTGKPVTENHILKQIPFEASFLKTLKRQFPTIESVSVRASAGVSFYVVISMNQRFAGEARQVILSAMSSNIRPKWTIVVDPDIDVHSSSEVEWAMAFRFQPHRIDDAEAERHADADDRHDGHRRIAQSMTQQHRQFLEAFGACGSDVVFSEGLRHAGAGDASDQGDINDGQSQPRQDQLSRPSP